MATFEFGAKVGGDSSGSGSLVSSGADLRTGARW
jgi:hypothetical protein